MVPDSSERLIRAGATLLCREHEVGDVKRIDISMPLFKGMPSFPGDPPLSVERLRSLEHGDPYNISRLSFGSHAGTHVDPPAHFVLSGATVDRLDLNSLNGPCRVVETDPRSGTVGPDEVVGLPPGTERVLFRTANSARWARSLEFFSDYVGLSTEGADALVERGIRLVGLDSLSVENDPSGTYPVHHILLRRGILILEGLLLDGVPRGEYLLECLPLRLRDGDGGPARATLVTE
jgi:arylformamidase